MHGVSTRKADDLVRALGIEGISRSEMSRICAALDERMEELRNRPLAGEYPQVWPDAKVVNTAAVVVVGVTRAGEREVVGFDVGPAESYGFWLSFLRGVVAQGLSGVKLVISDAHVGLRQALSEVLAGASWQRCPRALHAESAGARAAGSAGARGGVGSDDLRPARPGGRAGTARVRGPPSGEGLPARSGAPAGGGGGRDHVHGVPTNALEVDPLDEGPRVGSPGDREAVQRGWHLPQRGLRAASDRGDLRGARGRVAGRAAVLQHCVHGGLVRQLPGPAVPKEVITG